MLFRYLTWTGVCLLLFFVLFAVYAPPSLRMAIVQFGTKTLLIVLLLMALAAGLSRRR